MRKTLLRRLDDGSKQFAEQQPSPKRQRTQSLVEPGSQALLTSNKDSTFNDVVLYQTNATHLNLPYHTTTATPPPADSNITMHRRLKLTSVASYELEDEHYYKSVSFSPDGRCILTSSDDRKLRLFEVPLSNNITTSTTTTSTTTTTTATPSATTLSTTVQPVLTFIESETIYDTAWYPHMNSESPQTCVFASTSRNAPIHLFDAYTGAIRASYRAYDHYDELAPALSVAFNIEGSRLYAGFPRMIRIFDVGRPGKPIEERKTCLKRRGSTDGQKGLLSCIDFNPDYSGLYAVGSYSGSVWVYDDRTGDAVLSFDRAHYAGVTQVKWCPQSGQTLLSGGRRDNEIVMWDIRGGTNGALQRFQRAATTNQRFAFDVTEDGRYLVTGSSQRKISLHDLSMTAGGAEENNKNNNLGTGGCTMKDLEEEANKFPDSVNGIALGTSHAQGLIVTCTGQRRPQTGAISDETSDEEDHNIADDNSDREEEEERRRNRVEIWKCNV